MYKRLFSETLIYGVGAVLPRVLSFVLVGVITKATGAAEYSIYSQLYAIASFLNVILQFGFETSYFRYSVDKQQEQRVFNTAFIFLAVNSIIFLAAVYVFLPQIASYLKYQKFPQYIIWFSWFILLDTLCVVPFARLRFQGRPRVFTLIKLINSFIYFGLIVFFLFAYTSPPTEFLGFSINQKIGFVFIANLFASLATVFLLIPFMKGLSFRINPSLLKTMLNYSYPIMLAGIAYTLNENFDKMIQRGVISEVEAGAYGACYKLAALMTIVVMAFRMGVEPFFFKQMNNKNAKQTYATVMELFTIVASFIVVALLSNILWIKDIFLHRPEYLLAMKIVPIIVIANLFFGIYNTLSVWYKVSDKTLIGSSISWIGAILTLLINIFLLPLIGFMASAWATIAAYGSMMIISYFLGRKYYKIPYKVRKIVFYISLSILLGLISYYIFKGNIILGNIVVLLYLAIVYYLEKNVLLKSLLNENKNR